MSQSRILLHPSSAPRSILLPETLKQNLVPTLNCTLSEFRTRKKARAETAEKNLTRKKEEISLFNLIILAMMGLPVCPVEILQVAKKQTDDD